MSGSIVYARHPTILRSKSFVLIRLAREFPIIGLQDAQGLFSFLSFIVDFTLGVICAPTGFTGPVSRFPQKLLKIWTSGLVPTARRHAVV